MNEIWMRWVAAAAVVAVAIVVGYIYELLRRRFGPVSSFSLFAAVFALIHLSIADGSISLYGVMFQLGYGASLAAMALIPAWVFGFCRNRLRPANAPSEQKR